MVDGIENRENGNVGEGKVGRVVLWGFEIYFITTNLSDCSA